MLVVADLGTLCAMVWPQGSGSLSGGVNLVRLPHS